jgi:hypothetical protein
MTGKSPSFSLSLSLPLSPSLRTPTMKNSRKEIDSPTSATAYTPSNYDEKESEMTPTTMHERIGRIVVSAPSLDDSSDSIEISDNSPRHRNIRRGAVNRPYTTLDCCSDSLPGGEHDQYEVLSYALNQLNRLASLDSTEYQQRLLKNSLPALRTGISNVGSSTCPQIISPISSQSFQTPLMQLSMSIHRLHAVVANVTREVDGHPDEVQELQSQLSTLLRRNRQLESAAKKVHSKNLKLKQQSQKDRTVARRLQQRVHKYEALLESQEFQLMASKVQQHETQLQLFSSRSHNDNNCEQPSRDRTDSNISEFIDIAQIDICETVQTIEQEFSSKQQQQKESQKNNDQQHILSSSSSVSLRSEISETTTEATKDVDETTLATSSTSVTTFKSHSLFDDTAPTLCYSAQGSTTPISITSSDFVYDDNDDDLTTVTTTSNYLSPNVGDSHRGQSTAGGDDKIDTSNKSASSLAMPTLHNRFAKFLGPRPIQTYTLKMVPPYAVQFAALQVRVSLQYNSKNSDQHSQPPSSSSSSLPEDIMVVEDHGILKENDAAAPLIDNCSSTYKTTETAFAVSGFRGFDTDTTNVKPTLGARLIEINGESVDSKWTLEELYCALSDTSQSSNTNKNNHNKATKLTFRNEVWNKEQTKELKAASQQINKGSTPKTACIKKEGVNDALSNGSSNQRVNDKTQQNTRHHFLRARTASTESVGKAFNGLGNFLNNLQ